MDKLKFALFSVVVLLMLGLIGYWAIATLQSGNEFAASQKIEQLQKENEDLKKEAENLTNELSALRPKEEPKTEEIKQEPVQPTVYKYQNLINELQKLIDDNVFMKLKSGGGRVGTLQKFLNIYNNTSNKVDNDYGASTERAVKSFQKEQGLNADGQAGPGTFSQMIDWLKKQG